jgi:hypothetical protein
MKLKVVILLILIGLLNLTSCSFASSKLPLNPKSISIHWNKDGGMRYFSESISINRDTCEYHVNREGLKQDVKFILAENELRELNQIFIENQFDLIQTYEEEVHDRGGTSISLKVDGKSFNVSNSGMSFVKDNYYSAYKSVESAIHKYCEEELMSFKHEIVVKIDDSINNSEYNVILYINDKNVYSEKEVGAYKPISISLFQKNNKFEIYFMTQDGNHDYDKMVENYYVVLDSLPNKTELVIKLINGELTIE